MLSGREMIHLISFNSFDDKLKILNRQYFFQNYLVLCIETGKITDMVISDNYQAKSYEMYQLNSQVLGHFL